MILICDHSGDLMSNVNIGVIKKAGLSLLAIVSAGLLHTAAGAADAGTDAAPARNAEKFSEWTVNLTPQLSYGTYSNSSVRDYFATAGAVLDAKYLERGGFTVAASHTRLKYTNGTPTLSQDAGFLSGRINFTPDRLPGTLTLRGDIHLVGNTDATNETDEVRVFAPQVSFLNFDRSKYFDLGYAYSRYGDSNIGNPSLDVHQFTPTIGFALNQGADWVQLRLYDIHFSSSARTQNNSGTDALEAKWTHFMAPQPWVPEQIHASALIGRRLYAVDGDAANVYNLTDLQKGSVGIGAQWKLAPSAHLQLDGGYNRYQSQTAGISTNYSGSYIYTGLNWEFQ